VRPQLASAKLGLRECAESKQSHCPQYFRKICSYFSTKLSISALSSNLISTKIITDKAFGVSQKLPRV
jgi:hypothetical protein